MYYINSFFIYSLLGFIMESAFFKNTNPSRISGVLNGPITIVYGLGGLAIILINKYLLLKIKVNKILKIIIAFFIFAIILSLIEGISGYLCELIFDAEMWNYTTRKYHIGKYMCLELSLIWGLLGVMISCIIKPFFDKIVKLIPREVSYIFIAILSLDIIITIITK